MADFKEFILKNGDHITVKDETARNNISTLQESKIDKPETDGISGQSLVIDDNGDIVWGNVDNGAIGYDEENEGLYTDNTPGTIIQPGESAISVQPDWNQSDTSADDYIKNKPDLIGYLAEHSPTIITTTKTSTSRKVKVDNGIAVDVTFSGMSSFTGECIWTDGTDIYYSNGSSQYVLKKSTSTWNAKTWNGLTNFYGYNIWTDGTDIYYSENSKQYVLNKATSTWSVKTWNGFTNINGIAIWTDGNNIYYSGASNQYVLKKSTSTWNAKTWNGLTNFYGYNIWTDGDNIYYSEGSNQYVLNKSTSTWTAKTWNGYPSISGNYIWTDGTNIYYSGGFFTLVLNKATSTWTAKTWNGFTSFSGSNVWTDGTNIYCSSDTEHKKLINR